MFAWSLRGVMFKCENCNDVCLIPLSVEPQNQEHIFFLLLVVPFIHLDCFGVSDKALAISACLLSNTMELDCTQLVVLKA